tara:strand:- start:245 stop:466 length:222 start_codon:yes stop_codon:yes gene_type:complete
MTEPDVAFSGGMRATLPKALAAIGALLPVWAVEKPCRCILPDQMNPVADNADAEKSYILQILRYGIAFIQDVC